MNVGKRAFLYLTRKKGKNLLLGIVFLLISFSLLTGSAVYLGIRQVSEDLRSNIGARGERENSYQYSPCRTKQSCCWK